MIGIVDDIEMSGGIEVGHIYQNRRFWQDRPFRRQECKSDIRIQAYGTADELVAAIALARSFNSREYISDILKKVEEELFLLASELAAPKPDILKNKITQEHIDWLEKGLTR